MKLKVLPEAMIDCEAEEEDMIYVSSAFSSIQSKKSNTVMICISCHICLLENMPNLE